MDCETFYEKIRGRRMEGGRLLSEGDEGTSGYSSTPATSTPTSGYCILRLSQTALVFCVSSPGNCYLHVLIFALLCQHRASLGRSSMESTRHNYVVFPTSKLIATLAAINVRISLRLPVRWCNPPALLIFKGEPPLSSFVASPGGRSAALSLTARAFCFEPGTPVVISTMRASGPLQDWLWLSMHTQASQGGFQGAASRQDIVLRAR